MAEWPTVEAVKKSLGVTTADRDSMIASALAAAIEQVGVDLGYQEISVEEDSESGPSRYVLTASLHVHDPYNDLPDPEVVEIPPTNKLSNAALILAVMVVKAPDAPYGVAAVFDLGGMRVAAQHPTYLAMLTGQRLRFGVG